MNVYSHHGYLPLLNALMKEKRAVIGFKSKLAKAAGMHLPYLTRVMKGEIHITMDHAAGIAEFLNLNEPDTQYFLAMVQHDRAGTPRLRRILASQLKALRMAHDRGGKPKLEPTGAEITTEFCSDWVHSALYAALRIPGLNTASALARYFRLPNAVVESALNRLVGIGLVGRTGSSWNLIDGPDLYIDGRSWQGQMQTRNWRSYLVTRRSILQEDELTYTGTYVVARADIMKLRHILRDALNHAASILQASKPEELVLLTADLTRV